METDKVNGNVPLKRMTVALRRLPNRYLQHLVAYRQKRHKKRPKFRSEKQISGPSVSVKTENDLSLEYNLKRNDMSGSLAAQEFRNLQERQGNEQIFVSNNSNSYSRNTTTDYVMNSENEKKFVPPICGHNFTDEKSNAIQSSKMSDRLSSVCSSEKKATSDSYYSEQLSFYNLSNYETQEKSSMKPFQADKLQSCRESSFKWPKSLAKVTVDETKKSAQINHKPPHSYAVDNIWESYQSEFNIPNFKDDNEYEKQHTKRTENFNYISEERSVSEDDFCSRSPKVSPPPLIYQEAFLNPSSKEDEHSPESGNNSERAFNFDTRTERSDKVSNERDSVLESFKPASDNVIQPSHEEKNIISNQPSYSEHNDDIGFKDESLSKITGISNDKDTSQPEVAIRSSQPEVTNVVKKTDFENSCEMNNNKLNNGNIIFKGHNMPKLIEDSDSCESKTLNNDHSETLDVLETHWESESYETIPKLPQVETKNTGDDSIRHSKLQTENYNFLPSETSPVRNSTAIVIFQDANLSNSADELPVTTYTCDQSDNSPKQGDNAGDLSDNRPCYEKIDNNSLCDEITKECDQISDKISHPVYDGLPDFVPVDQLSLVEQQLSAQNQYKIETRCKDCPGIGQKFEDEINCNLEPHEPQVNKEKDQMEDNNDHNSSNFTLTKMPDLVSVNDDMHNDSLLTTNDNYHIPLGHSGFPQDRIFSEDNWHSSQEAMDEEWSSVSKSTSVRDEYMGADSPLKLVIEDVRSCPDYIHDGMEQSVLGMQSDPFDYDPSLPTLESQFISLGDSGMDCLDSPDFVSDNFHPETEETELIQKESNVTENLDLNKDCNEIAKGHKTEDGVDNCERLEEKSTELEDSIGGLSKIQDQNNLSQSLPEKDENENKKLDFVVNRLRGRLEKKKYNYDEEFLDDPDFITYSDSDTDTENILKHMQKNVKRKPQLLTKTIPKPVSNKSNKIRMELTKKVTTKKNKPKKKFTRLDKIKAQLRKSGMHIQTKPQNKPIVKKFNLRKRPRSNMELVLPTLIAPKRIRASLKPEPIDVKERFKPKLKPVLMPRKLEEKTIVQENVIHDKLDPLREKTIDEKTIDTKTIDEKSIEEKPIGEKVHDIKAKRSPLSPPKKRFYRAEESEDKEKEVENISPSCESRTSPPLLPKKRRSTETFVPGRKPKKVKPTTPPPDPSLYNDRLASDLPGYNWLELKLKQRAESKENCTPNTEKERPSPEKQVEKSPIQEAKKNQNLCQGETENLESKVKQATKDKVPSSPEAISPRSVCKKVPSSPETISPRSVCKKLSVASSPTHKKANEKAEKEKTVRNIAPKPKTKNLQKIAVSVETPVQTSQVVSVPIVTPAVLQATVASPTVVQNVPLVIMPVPQAKPLTPVPLVATVLPMPTSKPTSLTLCHSSHTSNHGKPKHTMFDAAPQRADTSITLAVPVQSRSVSSRWSSSELTETKISSSVVETSTKTKNVAVSPMKEVTTELVKSPTVKLPVSVPEEKMADGKPNSPVEPLDFSMKKSTVATKPTGTHHTEEIINIEPEICSPEVMDLSKNFGQQDNPAVSSHSEIITISPNVSAPAKSAKESDKRNSIDLTLTSSKRGKYKTKEKVEIDLTQCPGNDEEQTYNTKLTSNANNATKDVTNRNAKANLASNPNQSVFRQMRNSIHKNIEEERSVRNIPTAILIEFQKINQTAEKVNRYLKNISERRRRLCAEVYEKYGVVLDQKTFNLACSKYESSINQNSGVGKDKQPVLRTQLTDSLPGNPKEFSQHMGVQNDPKERRSSDIIRNPYPPITPERAVPQQLPPQKAVYLESQAPLMPVQNGVQMSPKQNHNSGGSVSIHSAFPTHPNPYPVQMPQKSPCARNNENVHVPETVLPRPVLEMPVAQNLPPPPAYKPTSYPNQVQPVQHAPRGRPSMEGRRPFHSPGVPGVPRVPGYVEQREQYPPVSDRQFIHKETAMQAVQQQQAQQQAQMVQPYLVPAQRPFPRLERPAQHNIRHPVSHDVAAFRRPEPQSPQRPVLPEHHPRMMPPSSLYQRPTRDKIPISVNEFNEPPYNNMQSCAPVPHQMGQPRHAFQAPWTNGASKSNNFMDAHVAHGHLMEPSHAPRPENVAVYPYHGPSNNVHGDFQSHHPCNIPESAMPHPRPHMHPQQNLPAVITRQVLPKPPVNQHQSIPPRVKTPPQRPTERPAPVPPRPDDSRKGACAVCGGSAVYLCSGCKNTWYCTKTCQATGWETHRLSCQ